MIIFDKLQRFWNMRSELDDLLNVRVSQSSYVTVSYESIEQRLYFFVPPLLRR